MCCARVAASLNLLRRWTSRSRHSRTGRSTLKMDFWQSGFFFA
jgi:hypothetical protein